MVHRHLVDLGRLVLAARLRPRLRGHPDPTEAGTIMGVFEIIVFGALAIWLVIEAGSNNTLSVFNTQHATAE